MSGAPFETRVSAKWVLAGEHAVLRGVPAVALPHDKLGLTLRYDPGESELEVDPVVASSVVQELLKQIQGLGLIRGRLSLGSTIPSGAGLGSSAALCVAMTRWVSGRLALPAAQWEEFASRLENHFHGKSSGMDIAVISRGVPVKFVRGAGASPMEIRKLPRFTFHDTGLRARTNECVAQVEAFARVNPQEARRVDQLMEDASKAAAEGLRLYDAGQVTAGLEQVALAMQWSTQCFERWDLLPGAACELQRSLLSQGARATKLTGAGRGGMVVALWD